MYLQPRTLRNGSPLRSGHEEVTLARVGCEEAAHPTAVVAGLRSADFGELGRVELTAEADRATGVNRRKQREQRVNHRRSVFALLPPRPPVQLPLARPWPRIND